jgi:hypothetical protein
VGNVSAVAEQPATAARLAELEGVIQRWRDQFAEVGKALRAIHAERLYLPKYRTWAIYLTERWGIDRTHGWYLMEAADLFDILEEAGLPTPVREHHCRPFVRLPPEKQVEVWREMVTETEPRNLTTEGIRAAVHPHIVPDNRVRKGGRNPGKTPPRRPQRQEPVAPQMHTRTAATALRATETQVYEGEVGRQQYFTVIIGPDGQSVWCPQVHLLEHRRRRVRVTVEFLS